MPVNLVESERQSVMAPGLPAADVFTRVPAVIMAMAKGGGNESES